MSCLSVFDESGIAFVCANPIFLVSGLDVRPGAKITFEVFKVDASGIRRIIGKREKFGLESQAFWGTVVSLEPCQSTVPALALLRDRPTMRGVIAVHGDSDPTEKN